jgi:hypothetical protein
VLTRPLHGDSHRHVHAGQAPHNHAKWLLSKKETLAKFNAKKKSLKAKKSKAGDDNNSTNKNVKRLKLR